MLPTDYITLFEYHYRRYRQLWKSIMMLEEAQFVQDVPYSLGSLRNHFVHLLNDEGRWFALLANRRDVITLEPADFAARAALRQHYDAQEAQHLAFIRQLDQATLRRIYWWDTPMALVPQQVAGWQILLHIINHGTDHRAQMLRILHDLGGNTFEQDLMRYLWQSGHIDPLQSGGGSDV